MRDKDLIGKAVVSMADGARLGAVKDLVFRGLDLEALVVHGDRGEGLLPFASLGTNGPDAITIDSYTLVDWNKGPSLGPETTDMHHMRKLPVVDGDGKMLGHLHGLRIDAAGHLEDISVRTEGVFGIGAHETVIPGSQVRAVGTNLITVEGAAKRSEHHVSKA